MTLALSPASGLPGSLARRVRRLLDCRTHAVRGSGVGYRPACRGRQRLLLQKAWPLLVHASPWQLLTGQVWEPHNGLFGFAPFIAGTVAVTFVAMVLAVVPAVLSGVYVAEYTSAKTRSLLKPMLDLLVGIPPVVFGLWGVLVVVPFIRNLAAPALGSTSATTFRCLPSRTPAATACWQPASCWPSWSFP